LLLDNNNSSIEPLLRSKTRHHVFLVFALFFSVSRVCTNLFVVLLEHRKVLACLRELAPSYITLAICNHEKHSRSTNLFHSFTDVPVHESTLGIHEVEFLV
jgi:hypothetical protein